VGDAFAALKGGDGADDAGHLPFVDVEVFLNGFGREEGATAAIVQRRFLLGPCRSFTRSSAWEASALLRRPLPAIHRCGIVTSSVPFFRERLFSMGELDD
jgi:hypothetical protein